MLVLQPVPFGSCESSCPTAAHLTAHYGGLAQPDFNKTNDDVGGDLEGPGAAGAVAWPRASPPMAQAGDLAVLFSMLAMCNTVLLHATVGLQGPYYRSSC